jgi:hypothetical protein
MCSGGLLADDDTSSEVPYFLTANHCLSRQKLADSAEFFFDYIKLCGTDCGDPENEIAKVVGGAEILSTSSTSDYTLAQINQAVPAGRVFLGWTNAEIAYSEGAGLFRLSHPSGGPMAYSEHVVDTAKGTCTSWPRGDWIYSTDTFGATEGGSSGSPVFNAGGEVVGQLSGACGYTPEIACDRSNATVDGALAAYHSQVAGWLGGGEPPCTSHAECGDNICCEGQCVAPACTSGADCGDGETCTTDTCSGVDCDASCSNTWATCDLETSDGCCGPACDSSTDIDCPSCGAIDSPCDANADCCSNKCRGKPGAKLCR